MSKANVYSVKGAKASSMTLPVVFSQKENEQLLGQALRVYEWQSHLGTHRVKTRAEVNISKRKIYKQKHTGNARHGAKSAPIFVGGGVTHGPKGIKRELSLPKTMRVKALALALSIKAKNEKIIVVGDLDKITKTSEAQVFLNKIFKGDFEGKTPKTTLLALSDKNKDVVKFFRNIKDITIVAYKNLNVHEVFFGGIILIDQEVFAVAKPKVDKKEVAKKPTKKVSAKK